MNYRQKAVYGNNIPEEELPMRYGIKVLRTSDPDYGLSEDEIADRNEFIRCYLAREFELFMMLPSTESNDFFIPDCHVANDGYSAFNTVDFQKTQTPFDKYGYAIKKVMQRVKDLAILHSVITSEKGRQNIINRFHALIDLEFRERLLGSVERYKVARTDEQKERLKKKIGELNYRILEAKHTWELNASPCS